MDSKEEVIRDCNTCSHHTQAVSIDDAPAHCWGCSQTVSLIHWEPKETLVVAQKLTPSEYASLHQATEEKLTAPEFLAEVQALIGQRGTERDKPKGERSMAQAVAIFTAMTGVEMTTAQGWQFMIALKFARMAGGKFKLDDYLDAIGYTALLTEEVVNGNS